MKLQLLGTGSSEGFPGLFCACEACRRATAAGGRNLKTRADALLEDRVLLDLSPDLLAQKQRFGLDLALVDTLVVTHSHEDHFDPYSLMLRLKERVAIACEGGNGRLEVYGNARVLEMAQRVVSEEYPAARLGLHPVRAFEPFEVQGLRFFPLRANHKPNEEALFYAVRKGGQALLYATDTGLLPEQDYAALQGLGWQFDAVVLDCTRGPISGGAQGGHMGLPEDIEVRRRLEEVGCTHPGTRWVLHHLSHSGGATYDELQAQVGPLGFEVAWDGMILEL
jgi:phosphoribosyl 1,2-cyclic phosphate phosphodiesterase